MSFMLLFLCLKKTMKRIKRHLILICSTLQNYTPTLLFYPFVKLFLTPKFHESHCIWFSHPPTNLCILALRKEKKFLHELWLFLISVIFILCSIPLLPPLLFGPSVSSCRHISLLCLTPLSSSPFALLVLVRDHCWTAFCVYILFWVCSFNADYEGYTI